MLPILARAAGGSIARKMMGRKTNVRVGQAQPQSSNAIVKSEKFTGRSAKAPPSLPRPPADVQDVSEKVSKDDPLKVIHTKTLAIEKILQGTLASEKAELKRKKNDFKNQNRQEQEENLEKKDVKPDKKMKMPKVPGAGGIFGFIKNFLGNIIMGFFLMKLVDNIGMLKGIFSAIDGIGNFIADFGIKLVDGLATFVDWGYKAYDATQGFLKNFGVKPELFDQFSGALSGLIDALIIGSVILAARGEDGFGPGGLDKARRPKGRTPGVTQGRGGQQPRFRIPGTRPRVTQGGGRRLPGAPVTQGRGGQKPKTRIPGTGPKVTGGGTKPKFPGGGTKPKFPGGKAGGGKGGLFGLIMLIPTLFEAGGLISQGYWKTAANVLLSTGAAMAAYAGTITAFGAAALALTGVSLGFGSPAAIALLVAGHITAMGASMGTYALTSKALKALGLRDDDPAVKAQGYQEGGRVKKPIKRSIGGKKRTTATARKFVRKPTPDKLPDLPQPTEKGGRNRAWWDFLGWAGTGNQPMGPGGEQLAQKVTDVGNTLGENDFFGPILRVTSKIILDQEVNSKDIQNVGLGINFLINKGLSDKKISEGIKGYAQGGMVSPFGDALSLEKWVEQAFKPIAKKDYPTRYTSGRMRTSDMDGDEVSTRTTSSMPTSGSGGTSLTGDNQAKWKAVYAMAEKAGAKYPELVAAQFGLESAWGTALAAKNNFFGIKATSSEDATVSNTREVVNGQSVYVDARFKNFNTPQDCINHLVTQWYKDYKGYSGVNNASDAQAAADQLLRENYATDPQYASSLKRIMSEYSGIRGTNADIASSLVMSGDSPDNPDDAGSGGSVGGDGKFIQGNSGASAGVHFHVGPGHQTDGTLLQSQYFADARASAKKVVDHFLGKGSTIYDGRRGVYFKSSDEVAAAQRAHTAGGSAGGIDMQVDFETPHKFPLKVSSMAYRRNGFGVSANIEGSKSFVSHGRYDEQGNVAPQERMKLYHAGLRLGGKEQIAKILKGETILDEDTSKALGSTLLARLDDASTPAGIQKVLQSVMGISEFPSYDSRAGQVIMIDDSDDTPMEEQPAPVTMGALGGTSYDNSMDFLDYQG